MIDKRLEQLINAFAQDLIESEKRFELRKQFIRRAMKKYSRGRAQLYRYLKALKNNETK